MDDIEQQLRRHYDGQQLPAARVQEILAAGRAAVAGRARRAWWRMAAAVVILGLGIFGANAYVRHQTRLIPLEAVAGAVVDYFSDPNYVLPQVSADRRTLVEWLRQRGGPANIEVPAGLAALPSYGCQVLQVQGQQVYLICFLLDAPPANATAGAMPEKKVMVTVGPDGQMMKKTRPLVHLMVVPKGKFAGTPKPGERLMLSANGDWNFTVWAQGDQVYIAAATVSAERLTGLVSAL